MNYQETIEYLFNSTPVFEKVGAKAYKPGLQPPKRLTSISDILIASSKAFMSQVPTAKVPALIPLLPFFNQKDTKLDSLHLHIW